jgi:molybdate transport system ATP-binding protein
MKASFRHAYSSGTVIECNVELDLENNPSFVVLGPSGAGKSTLLRCLAGLCRPQHGRIEFEDEVWLDTDRGQFQTPQQRRIGYLSQDLALFPHLNIAQNIGYGIGGTDRERAVRDMIARLKLEGLEGRYPSEISGGQQQRVALARAVVRKPRMLLLDEPLSSLDPHLKQEVRRELIQVLRGLSIPCMIVLHDRMDALAMAKQWLIMHSGKVVQQGAIDDVYSQPGSMDVARVVGFDNILIGSVRTQFNGQSLWTSHQASQFSLPLAKRVESDKVAIAFRAEDVTMNSKSDCKSELTTMHGVQGKIASIVREGGVNRYWVDVGVELQAVDKHNGSTWEPGTSVQIIIRPESVCVFDLRPS